jgi:predicted O-methyltransferase YrrM
MDNDTLPNWFQNDGLKNFQDVLIPEFSEKNARYLQIGAYTGDASVWLYDNLLKDTDSVLIDVDTWEGSEEPVHYQMNWTTVESLYDVKTSAARADRKIVKYKGTSDDFFKNNREMYDFVYIDGDHTSYGVIKDAISAYECLNVGGIVAFDDYLWLGSDNPEDCPRMAIDSFLAIYVKRVEVISRGYQLWATKIA